MSVSSTPASGEEREGEPRRSRRGAVQEQRHAGAHEEGDGEREREPEIEAREDRPSRERLREQHLDELPRRVHVRRAEHERHERDDEEHRVQQAQHHLRDPCRRRRRGPR